LLYGGSGFLAEIIKTVTVLTVTDGGNGCMKYKRIQQYKSLIICQHSTNYWLCNATVEKSHKYHTSHTKFKSKSV